MPHENPTISATGRFKKGIVRTPPDSFLNARTDIFVFGRRQAREPVKKSLAFGWAFDTIPI